MRALALLLVCGGMLAAQTATVQNSASAPIGCDEIFNPFTLPNPFPVLNTIGLGGALVAGDCMVSGSSVQNTVSPGMLVALEYPVTFNSLPPVLPVTVSIRPSGSVFAIPVKTVSISYNIVSFAMPRNMPLRGAELEYKVQGQPTAWTNVNVVASSFDLFKIGGGGPAMAQSVAANGSLNPVGLTTPAQPGQTIRLTGSGLGNAIGVSITVGGISAPLVSAQPHRYQPGIDEILFEMPAGVADGCYVPLVVAYGNTTVSSTISKTSNAAPCVHPFQLSTADMRTLDGGGSIEVGEIVLTSTLQVATAFAAHRNESASLQITPMTAAQIAAFAAQPRTTSNCNAVPSSGGFSYGGLAESLLGYIPNIGPSTLQSGTTELMFPAQPLNSSATIPAPTEGPLSGPPAPVIAGGMWTWQSAASSDLAASSFSFMLPAPFQLNGGTLPSFVHNQDQALTWNGAAFDSGAILNASLTGTDGSDGELEINCSAPANAGTLTIPGALLSQIAGGVLGSLNINVQETGASIPHTQFQLTDGSTLLMLVTNSSGEQLPADIQ